MALEWDYVANPCLKPLLSNSLVRRCPWFARVRAILSMQGLCGASVHLCTVPFLLHKMRMRLETCIICNWYHSLMVSALLLAAHNGPFLRFLSILFGYWWWRNGDRGCHLGRNKKNDGTFHLLVSKLALRAHDMMCITRVLVLGVADNNKGKNCPSKRETFQSFFYATEPGQKGNVTYLRREWIAHF